MSKTQKKRKLSNDIVIIWNGGSFSPLTKAHVEISNVVCNYMREKINKPVLHYWVPVSEQYEKSSVKTDLIGKDSDLTRLTLLEKGREYLTHKELESTSEFKNIYPINYMISSHEIEEERPVKTFESIEMLKAIVNSNYWTSFDNSCFYIMLGQDNVEQILAGKWKKPFTLLSANIICVPRPFDYIEDYQDFSIKSRVIENLLASLNIEKMLEQEPEGFGDKMDLNITNILECITIIDKPIPMEIITMSSTKVRDLLGKFYKETDPDIKQKIKENINKMIGFETDGYPTIEYIIKNEIYKSKPSV